MKSVVVIGGGLAGLVSSILLARKGIAVTVIEKKSFPFHRVCGEYISNEVVPFLKQHNLFPAGFNPPNITRFQLSSVSGASATLPLDLGGFGISRFAFDNFLFETARNSGVDVIQGEVTSVDFMDEKFLVKFSDAILQSDIVLGAIGKRSKLDVEWKRKFVALHSHYVGVKHHLKTSHPDDLIALHNFDGGYCGVSNVENGTTNLCYLVHRNKLREAGTIGLLEKNILSKNPHLKKIFSEAEFLFDKPETIGEISFETKEPIFNHVLLLGDAAGMITPLCGNGMAMAIRSANMVSDLLASFCESKISRAAMESQYNSQWRKTFSGHLWFGRQVQKLFGNELASNVAIQLAVRTPWIAKTIIKNTHGQPF